MFVFQYIIIKKTTTAFHGKLSRAKLLKKKITHKRKIYFFSIMRITNQNQR